MKSVNAHFLLLIIPFFVQGMQAPPVGHETIEGLPVTSENMESARMIGNHRMSDKLIYKSKQKIYAASLKSKGYDDKRITSELNSWNSVNAPPSSWTGLPTSGTVNLLTILVDFSDYRAAALYPSITSGNVAANLYGDGSITAQSYVPFESLHNYWNRASEGVLDLTGNVSEWYHFANARSSYAKGNTSPNNQALFDMLSEVLDSMDATHDFSQYDNDGDGYIDAVNIIYAGAPGSWGSFWWGYQWSFYVWDAYNTYYDGKRVRDFTFQWLYTRSGDTDYNPVVMTHETGHLLGLPDLYDYDASVGPDGGVGGLDMMHGNHGNPNAFFRWILDWIEPEIIPSGTPASRSLRASGDTSFNQNKAVVVFPSASDNPFTEFFIVENRYRTGNDGGASNLPSNGLIIWHIDATLNGSGTDYLYDNSYTNRKLVRLMEADGLEEIETNSSWADSGDYYKNGSIFSPQSEPSSAAYSGADTSVKVSDISISSLQMTAKIGRSTSVAGDVDGDGKPDLLWQNKTNGEVESWLMDSAWGVINTEVPVSPAASIGKLVALADMDNDGINDFIWTSQEGSRQVVTLWELNANRSLKHSIELARVAAPYVFRAAGDLNGDGFDDLVWQDSNTGKVIVWYMDGAGGRSSYAALTGSVPVYKVQLLEDMNGDGNDDIVWQGDVNGKNRIIVWFMNGNGHRSSWNHVASVDGNWSLSSAGDYNLDSSMDFVWFNDLQKRAVGWLFDENMRRISFKDVATNRTDWNIAHW